MREALLDVRGEYYYMLHLPREVQQATRICVLEVGDFQISENNSILAVVERKGFADLLTSTKSGRLRDYTVAMSRLACRKFLLVEGIEPACMDVLAQIVHHCRALRIYLVLTRNYNETADFYARLFASSQLTRIAAPPCEKRSFYHKLVHNLFGEDAQTVLKAFSAFPRNIPAYEIADKLKQAGVSNTQIQVYMDLACERTFVGKKRSIVYLHSLQ